MLKIADNENEKLQQENKTLANKLKASDIENDTKQTIEELFHTKNKLQDELTQYFQKTNEENQLIYNEQINKLGIIFKLVNSRQKVIEIVISHQLREGYH